MKIQMLALAVVVMVFIEHATSSPDFTKRENGKGRRYLTSDS